MLIHLKSYFCLSGIKPSPPTTAEASNNNCVMSLPVKSNNVPNTAVNIQAMPLRVDGSLKFIFTVMAPD